MTEETQNKLKYRPSCKITLLVSRKMVSNATSIPNQISSEFTPLRDRVHYLLERIFISNRLNE